MTLTRKYYNDLIDILGEICKSTADSPIEYINIRKRLFTRIRSIEEFYLFELTFSSPVLEILCSDKITDFEAEKLIIVNELQYELNECLWVTRLRYGGELMQYSIRIQLALLNLSLQELLRFALIKKDPKMNFLPECLTFKNESDKQSKIDKLKKELSTFKEKTPQKLETKLYDILEGELKSKIADYKDYVFKNYPSISHHFHWYNKKIRAYVTESTNKDNIEFRINSYSSEDGDTSATVKKEFYDFYPSYYYNLEEIPQKPNSWIVVGVKKSNPELRYGFDVQSIHRELISIFLKNATEVQIRELVKLLLRCKDFNFMQDNPDLVSDFTATYGNDTLEGYFYHKRQLPLQDLILFIENAKNKTSNSNLFFVFTIRPDKAITDLLSERKILFYILDDLISMQVSVGNSIILHWFIQSELQNLNVKTATQKNDTTGESLIDRINQCPPGEKSWREYENIGIEVFHFLFEDNFKPYQYHSQAQNDSQRHRRDLLVHNTSIDHSSFWNRIRHDNDAKVITIEFKNYSDKLDSNTLFNSTKYAKREVGNLIIVFSRKGLGDSARNEQLSVLQNSSRVVLAFEDEEIKDMIREKMIGKNPLDRFDSKLFELRKRI